MAELKEYTYNFLIESIRKADVDKKLERFLEAVQYLYNWMYTKPDELWDLLDIETVWSLTSDIYLPYITENVGIPFDAVRTADATTLRKLIMYAPALWKEKGTTHSLINITRLISGVEPVYKDFFDYRWTLEDDGYLGDDCVVCSPEGEHEVDMYIVDGGTVDKASLANILALARPYGERIRMYYCLFADDFIAKSYHWAGDYDFDNVAGGRYVIDNDEEISVNYPGKEEWSSYQIYFNARAWKNAGDPNMDTYDNFYYKFAVKDANNYYKVKIDYKLQQLTLNKVVNGTEMWSETGSFNIFPNWNTNPPPLYHHMASIEKRKLGTGNRILISIDHAIIIDKEDAGDEAKLQIVQQNDGYDAEDSTFSMFATTDNDDRKVGFIRLPYGFLNSKNGDIIEEIELPYDVTIVGAYATVKTAPSGGALDLRLQDDPTTPTYEESVSIYDGTNESVLVSMNMPISAGNKLYVKQQAGWDADDVGLLIFYDHVSDMFPIFIKEPYVFMPGMDGDVFDNIQFPQAVTIKKFKVIVKTAPTADAQFHLQDDAVTPTETIVATIPSGTKESVMVTGSISLAANDKLYVKQHHGYDCEDALLEIFYEDTAGTPKHAVVAKLPYPFTSIGNGDILETLVSAYGSFTVTEAYTHVQTAPSGGGAVFRVKNNMPTPAYFDITVADGNNDSNLGTGSVPLETITKGYVLFGSALADGMKVDIDDVRIMDMPPKYTYIDGDGVKHYGFVPEME